MGRRSDFPRIPKDLYETPPEGVAALLPHVAKGTRYAEPCAGNGALIEHLRGHLDLAWASDIEPRPHLDIHENDALTVGLGNASMFVTNPPWSRPILHPLIRHLSDLAPTWLLFDSAWANTKQATPFMSRCRRIVAVGRLKWIPGTKWVGKEDASWYLFDRPVPGSEPVFYGRGRIPTTATHGRHRRICFDCGALIDRFGKWRLQPRNGMVTTVHVDCADPSGVSAHEPEPMPLMDYLFPATTAPMTRWFSVEAGADEPEPADNGLEIPSFLKRLAAR